MRAEEVTCQAVRIGLAAMKAILQMEGDEAAVYLDFVNAALSAAARKVLEMIPQNYEFQDEGLRKAWHGGKAEGEAKGKAEGLANALLLVLEARGFTLSASEAETIRECRDIDTLAAWLRRAPTVATAADLFL